MTWVCNQLKCWGARAPMTVDKITESNSRVPPVSVVCSSTIKHKPVFLNQWNEIGDNRFSSLIHFTHQQPPEKQK